MRLALLWLLAAAAAAMLTRPFTRNAAYMILAGTVLGFLLHYDIATIPEVRNVAVFLWTAAVVLLLSNWRNQHRHRRTA